MTFSLVTTPLGRGAGAMLVMLLCLTAATHGRNSAWKTELGMCLDVVKKSPAKPRGLSNLGMVYADMGRDDLAIEAYSTALLHNPGYLHANHNIGVAYAKQGRTDLAARHFLTVVKLNPKYAEQRYPVGIAYRGDDASAAAIAAAAAHYNFARASSDAGLVETAIKQYRLALRAAPDYLDARVNLGIAYGEQGLLDNAIDQFLAALRIDPDDPVVHQNLANAYRLKGLTRVAEEHRRRARELHKKRPDLR